VTDGFADLRATLWAGNFDDFVVKHIASLREDVFIVCKIEAQ